MPDNPSRKNLNDTDMPYTAMNIDELQELSAAETNLEEMIGDRLRRYYATRLSQPLPDKFVDLLRHLAKKEAEG